MKWYQAILKKILRGIILFLFPLILLLFILGKALGLVKGLIQPILNRLPEERILGVGMATLVSIAFVLLICYLAGYLVERKSIRKWIVKLEDNLLIYIPGYSMIKSNLGETIGDKGSNWQTVLIEEDDDWKIGIRMDRQPNGYCTVFFPEPPDAKSGEIKIVHESKIKPLDLPAGSLVKMVRKYGVGISSAVDKVG